MPSPTTERSVADVLRAAKDRIKDPERWTQGAVARDGKGQPCEYEKAVCFCALGSLEFECIGLYEAGYSWLVRAARGLGIVGVSKVNDRLGHAATMEMYDCAIQLAEAASA